MNAQDKLLRGGLFLLLVLTTIRDASAGLITTAPMDWGAALTVDSVWKREPTGEYLPANGITIGQEHSGHGPYNLYRTYMVFELPTFAGLIATESLGLGAGALDDYDLVRMKATGATLHLSSLELGAFPYSDLTLEFRRSPLVASELLAGNVDLETVFQTLGHGTVWSQPLIPFMQAEDFIFPNYAVPMNAAFMNYLNSREGGQFVVSLTLPFIPETRDFGDTYHLITMKDRVYLETQMEFFTPDFSPVPEPSTYGLFAGIGLLTVALWRRRRQALAG